MKISPFKKAKLLVVIGFYTILPCQVVFADYSVVVNRTDKQLVWEGWGTSLSWWAKGIGNSPYEDLHADLMFTTKNVEVMPGQVLPGLGLNITRFNPGGGGIASDNISGAIDNRPNIMNWYRDIDGYWLNWFDRNPQSASWDWNRDPNQRKMLEAAKLRGARFEFFFNAPMWWMTYEKSSAGGRLQPWNQSDYAYYIASVVNHAINNWNIDVFSVEPFNEPSAGWWNYPNITQEGLNLSLDQQVDILSKLRSELNLLGLNKVQIAAADENNMLQAINGYQYFINKGVSNVVNRMNVHSYSGLDPWRDNSARIRLKNLVGNKPISVSEYGDNDANGMTLAQTIIEDINYLKPSSWVYWQAIEPFSGWGLINSDYYWDSSEFDPNRGRPYVINNKYFLFAQFTRYLRPNDLVIGANDKNTIVAYDEANQQLKFITVNFGNPQKITYDLNDININNSMLSTVKATYSSADGTQKFREFTPVINNGMMEVNAEANAVYSIVIDHVALFSTNAKPVVNISEPMTNTVLRKGEPFRITAQASDQNGAITKVEFYNGNALIKSIFNPPYILEGSTSNISTGVYNITAKAYDDQGDTTISNLVTISVNPSNNLNPSIRIISNDNNMTLKRGDVYRFLAEASDPDGRVVKVEFYNGDNLIKVLDKEPYVLEGSTSNIPSGEYNISVKAYDDQGAKANSNILKVILVD